MDTILNRISEIAMNEGIKISVLERTIKASKGVLSRAINNGTDIQMKWIQAIVDNYPNYSAEWLLTGRGSMIKEEEKKNKNINQSIIGDRNQMVGKNVYNNSLSELEKQIKSLTETINSLHQQIKEKDKMINNLINQQTLLINKLTNQ